MKVSVLFAKLKPVSANRTQHLVEQYVNKHGCVEEKCVHYITVSVKCLAIMSEKQTSAYKE